MDELKSLLQGCVCFIPILGSEDVQKHLPSSVWVVGIHMVLILLLGNREAEVRHRDGKVQATEVPACPTRPQAASGDGVPLCSFNLW